MGQKISLDQVAKELGISRRGVGRLIASGELRAYQVGKRLVRVDIDDLAAVMKPLVPSGIYDTPDPPANRPKRRNAKRANTSRSRSA